VETVLEIDERPFLPDPLTQLLVCNHVAGMRQQDQQNLKRLTGQTDTYAALEQLPRWNIHFKGSEGQPSRRLRLGRHKVSPTGSPQSTTGPWRVMRWADKYRTFNHLPDEAILSHK
jgi:hypothetical protein